MANEKRIRLTWLAAILLISALEARAADGRRIVVSLSEHKLTLYDGARVLKTYDAAVGKPSSPSPEGEYQVVNRIPNPTWYTRGRVVRPGKRNPLGTRWIGLSIKGYGIHGTNAPGSIGKAVSHGCIRMRNQDVEELFDLIAVGVPVEFAAGRPAATEQSTEITE